MINITDMLANQIARDAADEEVSVKHRKGGMSKTDVISLCVEGSKLLNLSTNGIRVLEMLEVGKTNAIKSFSDGPDTRALRRGVSELRSIGVPIINLSNGSGYYIADLTLEEDLHDLAITRNLLTTRMLKLCAVAQGLTVAIKKAEQMESDVAGGIKGGE